VPRVHLALARVLTCLLDLYYSNPHPVAAVLAVIHKPFSSLHNDLRPPATPRAVSLVRPPRTHPMSTPKISFRVPTPGGDVPTEATGNVTAQDVASAPGKEREREPLYGGDVANISEPMVVDAPVGGGSGFLFLIQSSGSVAHSHAAVHPSSSFLRSLAACWLPRRQACDHLVLIASLQNHHHPHLKHPSSRLLRLHFANPPTRPPRPPRPTRARPLTPRPSVPPPLTSTPWRRRT
jgi:hypothetical protein